MWIVTKGKKVEVALKYLKQESQENHVKEFMNLLGQWAFLNSSAIARLFGTAFSFNESPMVMEYFTLGPLDQYLRTNRGIMQSEDLIEATNDLAAAVWHLKENNLVHGRIRCRKLMVYSHDENAFKVKLADPGIHTNYTPTDVHWIPVECYHTHLEKRSHAGDVWAMATTMYEIYTYGKELPITDHIQIMGAYFNGHRLHQPPGCHDEVYRIMTECWHADPHRRKPAQEVSRDVNRILTQEFNSRRNHPYEMVGKKTHSSVSRRRSSVRSNISDATRIVGDTGDFELVAVSDTVSTRSQGSSFSDASSQNWRSSSRNLINFDPDLAKSRDFSEIFSNVTFSTATTSLDSLNSMQNIFELDDNYNVVLQGRIGQGYYGEVYKGTMENLLIPSSELQIVAVKKLKSIGSGLADFEREITIMKTLKHNNIVEILGFRRDPEIILVMEYVQIGSLQSYLNIHKDKLQTKQLLKYAFDIAMGMDYLGQQNIVHRDLATRNVLVVDEDHVKISDFGLAQFIGFNDYYIVKNRNRELPIKWHAPESLEFLKFSVKSDVWSYGVTLYEMFDYGENPPALGNIDKVPEGQEQQVLLNALKRGARYPCPEHCPRAIYVSIIRPCWEKDPHERPTFSQLALDVKEEIHQY